MSQAMQDGRAGAPQLPKSVLAINTACFALSFAVWVIFGPSARLIAQELHLSPVQGTFLKSMPILVGAVMRIPIGILADRLGARLMFPLLMLAGACAAAAVSIGHSYAHLVGAGAVLGLVGATFAVGVQSVSSWTPREKQGTALGIFGAGNVGTAITTLALPFLLSAWGWRAGFRIYALVLTLAALSYWTGMRNAPRQSAAPRLAQLLQPLGSARTWRFGLYYMATFGVFVATTLSVSDVYVEGYHVSAKLAGVLATTFTFSASLIRIVGGRLADRYGARAVVRWSLLGIVVALAPITLAPPIAVTVFLVFSGGLMMGIGMAGTFRYIPDYFPTAVGAVGGIVGALGGVGGFLIPLLSTIAKERGGSVYWGLLPLALIAAIAATVQQLALTDRPERRVVGDVVRA
jgi:MFS transporter, NNP family, nitrate/nitrite transporter